MTDEAPLVKRLSVQADAIGTAGNDGQSVIGEAPFDGTVTRAVYIPAAAITGAATNYRTISVTNRAQDGTGTTVVATLAFSSSGVTAAKDDARTVPLSTTAAHLVVAAGDVLTFDSVHTASGLADPGGTVEIEITRS